MILKLFFKGTSEEVKQPLNKQVNGFMNRLLGDSNKYHGTYSDYCVSTLRPVACLDGPEYKEEGCSNNEVFNKGAVLFISSNDATFIALLMESLLEMVKPAYIGPFMYERMEVTEYAPFSDYDVIRTISPICLKKHDDFYTLKDEDFITRLQEHCINKLEKSCIAKDVAETIKLEPFHMENGKFVCVQIGRAKNPASHVMLVVKGVKKARKALYNRGLGICTGFGFGCVKIMNKYNL